MPKPIDALLARPYILLIVIALLLFSAGINSYSLRGSTEPREAGVAAEMLQDSQLLVPRLNGRAFLEKPPLSYWLQAVALQRAGYEPATVRLPSLIAGIAAVCLVFYHLKKIGVSRPLSLLGALLLLTMASFWMNARMAGQDALLMLGVALTLFSFNRARTMPSPWLMWFAFALGISIATLTKGVVGLAVPGVVIFSFLMSEIFVADGRFIWRHWWRPAAFAALGLLPLLCWLFELYQHEGMAAVQQIVWSNSVDRFAGDYQFGAHSEPFYYYLTKLPETFAPWNVLVFFALWQLRREITRDKNLLFFCCWLFTPYLLLSISAGKRPPYLLMIYPAAAALIILYMQRATAAISAAAQTQNTVIYRLALCQTLLLSGIVIFTVAHAWKLHAHSAALVLLVALTAIIVLLWRNLLARRWRSVSTYAVLTMLVVYIGYGAVILRHETRQDSPAEIFAHMRALEHEGHALALFRPMERIEGAANFYLQHSLPSFNDAATLQTLLNQDSSTAVLVAENDAVSLHDYRVLANFLQQKRKFLLISGNASSTPGH